MKFNLYGFILGLSLVLASLLVEKKAEQKNINTNFLWQNLLWVVLGGVLGARTWHVISDFYLYQNNFWGIFKIWQGGLSILGAVLGAVITLKLRSQNQKIFLTWLDLAIFGLPAAQALGRLANYFNRELYGLPTNLPWAIYIQQKGYHPLFLYESILTASFAIWLWHSKQDRKVGTGKVFLNYLAFYSLIRFLLDFLRLDKNIIFLNLGINQIILLILLIILCLRKLISYRAWLPA